MKKRIVAVLLSLTLSSAMLAEAGAAAVTEVSAAELFTSGVSGEAGAVIGTEETGDTMPVTEPAAETGTDDTTFDDETDITIEVPIDGESGGTEDPSGSTETPGAAEETEDPSADQAADAEVEFTDDLFVSETVPETDAVQDQNTQVSVEETEDPAVAASSVEAEGKLLYTRWRVQTDGSWKLQKLPETTPAPETPETPETTPAPETPETTPAAVGETEAEPEAAALLTAEAAVFTEDLQTAETEMTAEDAAPAETTAEDAAPVAEEAADSVGVTTAEYYTAEDGLVTITTVDDKGNQLATGTYLFDENGRMVTGRRTVKVGTKGFEYTEDAEYYFLPTEKAVVTNPDTAAGNTLTPYNSTLGQMQKNISWFWEDGAFHRYGADGREDFEADTIYRIGQDYYYLLEDGTPYVGMIKATYSGNGRTGFYCFTEAESEDEIPGKMLFNEWAYRRMPKGTQWLYFGKDGRWVKKGCGAYQVIPSRDMLYLLDANGYLITNRVVKAANGYYYMSNRYAQVQRDKLVKIGNYRYYFIKDGRRATYKNKWVRLPGAGNRYYYFGTGGRIQEKTGFQKITVNGKFIGWFYFSKAGNHYTDYFSGDRYFLPDGRLASGVCKVDGRYYFFERSSSTAYKGKMYKGTWIKYNNKYYYAASNGNLATNGWRTIRNEYYYFKNCTALTNYNIKKGDVYGRLDSRGKFVTGWMVANDAKNRARYMDPKTGRFLKNTSLKIDGLLYYFDSNGYRRTDLTDIYKGPYRLEVDRVNGVMTVYNSARTVPVKTIRVSVGLPSTPTPLGNSYTVKRADRWQLLMGPSWGQYGSHVTGGIYIHSVACTYKNANNLPAGEYLKLGSPASHGCIRCCVADAKWVWDNCNGARIRIFDGEYQEDECFKGPLGRNPLTPLRGSGTFDPTDPLYN